MTISQKTFIYFLPLLLVTVFLFLAFKPESHAADATLPRGTPLPSFNLPNLYQPGRNLTEKDFQGQVALLNVWSPSCHFCREEHPFLLIIKQKYHVPIYGLLFREDPDVAKAWLTTHGNPYEMIGVDPYGITAISLQVSGTPQAFIIDAQGKIRYQIVGVIDQEAWEQRIYPLIQQIQHE